MEKMVSLLMFDYDGVLVDSFQDVAAIFVAVCHQCGFQAIRSPEHFRSMFEDNFFISMKALGAKEETINTILTIYGNQVSNNMNNTNMFDGVQDMLQDLSSNHPLYVITSNLSHVPLTVFQKHGVDCIRGVFGAEKEKSKIKKMNKIMECYPDLTPYYVGDTKGDMIEGKEAGALTVAVTWGWHSEEKLAEGKPDYIIHSPEELSHLLKK